MLRKMIATFTVSQIDGETYKQRQRAIGKRDFPPKTLFQLTDTARAYEYANCNMAAWLHADSSLSSLLKGD